MPDLLDLETLLRDVRPEPDPAWTARLDSRVAARFPGPPPRWRRPFTFARGHLVPLGSLAAVALVVVLVATQVHGGSELDSVTSSSSGGASSSAATKSSASAPAAPRSSAESAAGSAEVPQPDSAAAPTAAATPAAGRLVQRDASLTLSARRESVEDVADGVIRITDSLGGYVQSSSVSAGSSAGAQLSLKIPQERLQQALAKLSALAHVKRRTQESEDVTDQRSALEADVRDARADRDGLRRRLARAGTDKEAQRARTLLARAERRLTSRERAVANLSRSAALATIDVTVRGDAPRHSAAPVAGGGRWTPGDALHDAGRVLEVVAGVLLLALAVALPLALLAALAGLTWNLLVRRRRERALELA
jgi:Domain of unknown function (DUF4349)